MNGILTIVKKELKRFFGDRRMLATILLPGVLIYVLYSFMGSALTSELMTPQEYEYKVYAENAPASVRAMIEAFELPFDFVEAPEDAKADIAEQKLDLYAVFPEHFDEFVADKMSNGLQNTTDAIPNVEIYYNSVSTNSQGAYSMLTSLLDAYEEGMINVFNVNAGDEVYDLATAEGTTGMIFSMLMPLLIVVMMFSACMAVAPESIAGEKERGTIATLLVTPVKRSSIAIGKIVSLSIISLLSGLCSFVGIILSLPKLMGGEDMGMIDANIYSVVDYAWILAVILSTVLVFISLISLISALAKSVKEATSYISPLMILVMLISLGGMFGFTSDSAAMYFIPVYNSVQCISHVFALEYEPLHVVITVSANIITAGVAVFALTKMFNSERIMFRK